MTTRTLARVVPLWAVLLSGSAASAAEQARPAPPNILLILADDMGFSDLGCYGGEIATPTLDALSRGGLRYTQAYNTGRCWPSRAALLTGYYAQGVRRDKLPGAGGGNQGQRPQWARLLPDYLRPLGYRSYHSGKWHVDGKVLEAGFDRSLLVNNHGNYFSRRGNALDDVPLPPADDEPGYYVTRAIADHAIECLRDHAAHHGDRPFFQFLAFIAPHFPLHALPDDIARYQSRYLAGWEALRAERHARQLQLGIHRAKLSPLERQVGPPHDHPDSLAKLGPAEVNRPLPWDALTDEQRRLQAAKMAIHAAMVDRMDREIGRVVAQLRAMNALDNTLLVFASDNGASAEILVRDGGHDRSAAPGSAATYLCLGPGFSSAANTPFRRHKTWVHEGGISTPLVVHWPRGIAARGELRTTPVHFVDFVPTAIELAGGKLPASWQGEPLPPPPGKSLVPTLSRDAPIQRELLWWLHEGNRAIRIGDWKLVAARGGPWELFDLAADRSETVDLAAAHPDRVRDLERRWTEQLEQQRKLAAPGR